MPSLSKRLVLPQFIQRIALRIRLLCIDLEIADKEKLMPLITDPHEFARLMLARADACIEYAHVRALYLNTFRRPAAQPRLCNVTLRRVK